MRTTLRAALLTTGLALAALLGPATLEARAQNTYADAPFNQGSLFYRPSGRKAPQTTYARPARVYRQAAPTYYYPTAATTYAAPARVYTAPAPGTYYTAPRAYPTRRGLFRRSY